MRLDKYLKISRIIKRRTVANEACDAGRIEVNGRVVKASYDVKVGDVMTIKMGTIPSQPRYLQCLSLCRKTVQKSFTKLSRDKTFAICEAYNRQRAV